MVNANSCWHLSRFLDFQGGSPWQSTVFAASQVQSCPLLLQTRCIDHATLTNLSHAVLFCEALLRKECLEGLSKMFLDHWLAGWLWVNVTPRSLRPTRRARFHSVPVAPRTEALETRNLLTTVDLGALGSLGLTIYGAESGDQSGFSVSRTGDVNGDGYEDFVIGAERADGVSNGKFNSGETYLVFGGSSLPASIELATLGSAGVRILGADISDYSGGHVSAAGDVNGDGFADFCLTAQEADINPASEDNRGKTYLIFGGAALPSTIDLANLGSSGSVFHGAGSQDQSGSAVSAGDLNGDGYDDLVIGAYKASALNNVRIRSGEVYVVFGAATFPAVIDLGSLGTGGFTIAGVQGSDNLGNSVSSAGDMNGDGFDDLVIAASSADSFNNTRSRAGETYVIFGSTTFPALIDLAVTGSADVIISGVDSNDYSGYSISGGGDVNGDGFDDIVIGAPRAEGSDNVGGESGEAYIVYGQASLPATIDLANLGSQGVTIFGLLHPGGGFRDDRFGSSVSIAGDVNGDGCDDVVIGATLTHSPDNFEFDTGAAYLIFGGRTLPTTIAIDSLADGGNVYLGIDEFDRTGLSVSGAGDVNGDGFADFLIGSHTADGKNNTTPYSGESYLIFGGNFTDAVTHLGTNDGETLKGNDHNNIMYGLGGNDILLGVYGADILYGGSGDDVIAIPSLEFRRIDGGPGTDTLLLQGKFMFLDLSTIPRSRLSNIEIIDIRGVGRNTLKLTAQDVLRVTTSSGGHHTLTVLRNSDDVIDMGEGWTSGPNVEENGVTYNTYTQGAATLRVQQILFNQVELLGADPRRFVFYGAEAYNGLGVAVGSAGDVNGDGFDDLLITAPGGAGLDGSRPGAGMTYVVFGRPTSPLSLDMRQFASNGFVILGPDTLDAVGGAVSGAGDVNGDGFDDLIIGARNTAGLGSGTEDIGASYIVFGGSALPATIDLNDLGTGGVKLYGAPGNVYSGGQVAAAGDVNGDGFDDVVIGTGLFGDGDGYVVFGGASLPAVIELAALGNLGIIVHPPAGPFEVNLSVSGAGDFNGDGFHDLLFGVPQFDTETGTIYGKGAAYIVYGSTTLPATLDLANLGHAGVSIPGGDRFASVGKFVSSAGDLNGDGYGDVIILAKFAESQVFVGSPGDCYVIYGGPALASTFDLANLGTSGIRIVGEPFESSDTPRSAGDVNGDGFDDLLIGANFARGTSPEVSGAGRTYVIFGGSALPTTIDLATFNSGGLIVYGSYYDEIGQAVSSAGDFNGDGFDDLIIGASRKSSFAFLFDEGRVHSGEADLIFGDNFAGVSMLRGNSTAETLTGSGIADLIIGGGGADRLVGNGGADVLRGGQGDDVLVVTNTNFRRLDGGNGFDTLQLDGSGLHLNLTLIGDTRLTELEAIDIRGSGANSLTLNHREVLIITQNSSAGHTVDTLRIRRDGNDTINMGSGWTTSGRVMHEGVRYDTFQQGTATLLVEVIAVPELEIDSEPVTSIKKAPTVVLPDVTVGGSNLAGGTLLISMPSVGKKKSLDTLSAGPFESFGTSSGIQFTNGKQTLLIQLKPTATAAAIETFLRTIKFSTKGAGLKTATRIITVTLTSPDGPATTITQSINVKKKA